MKGCDGMRTTGSGRLSVEEEMAIRGFAGIVGVVGRIEELGRRLAAPRLQAKLRERYDRELSDLFSLERDLLGGTPGCSGARRGRLGDDVRPIGSDSVSPYLDTAESKRFIRSFIRRAGRLSVRS